MPGVSAGTGSAAGDRRRTAEIGRHRADLAGAGHSSVSVCFRWWTWPSDAQQGPIRRRRSRGGITAALNEPGSPLPNRPATTFTAGGSTGTKVAVSIRLVEMDWSSPPIAALLWCRPTPTGTTRQIADVSQVRTMHGHLRDVIGRVRRRAGGEPRSRSSQLVLGASEPSSGHLGGCCGDGGHVANRGAVRRAHTSGGRRSTGRVYIASGTLDLAAMSRCGGYRRAGRRPGRLDVLGYWLASGRTGHADLSSPARRHGHGCHLSDAPVLLVDRDLPADSQRPTHPPRSGRARTRGERNVHRTAPEQRALQAELRGNGNLISPEEAKRPTGTTRRIARSSNGWAPDGSSGRLARSSAAGSDRSSGRSSSTGRPGRRATRR